VLLCKIVVDRRQYIPEDDSEDQKLLRETGIRTGDDIISLRYSGMKVG
jgi:hypothetical protein